MVSKKVKLKKALSLIEVIIAISLLSFVIVTLLSLKDQNIFLINKVKGSFITNTYFSSLVLSTEIKEGENKNIYLSDVMTFSKDEDNRMLKNIKIHFKNKQYDKEEFNLIKTMKKASKLAITATAKNGNHFRAIVARSWKFINQ